MRDYLTIGSTPPEEDCAQVGSENYRKRAKAEVARYRELILKTCGAPPAGTELKAKWNPHDFGEYVELVVEYDEDDPIGLEYALHVESHGPSNWAGDNAERFLPLSGEFTAAEGRAYRRELMGEEPFKGKD